MGFLISLASTELLLCFCGTRTVASTPSRTAALSPRVRVTAGSSGLWFIWWPGYTLHRGALVLFSPALLPRAGAC